MPVKVGTLTTATRPSAGAGVGPVIPDLQLPIWETELRVSSGSGFGRSGVARTTHG
jgi:hypothetical protein